MSIDTLSNIGGVFAVLSFVHFFVDWGFQTHSEAKSKHNNWRVRALHCLVYAVGFLPVLCALNLSVAFVALILGILWLSHFIEDTYLPVFLWARYIRRPPQFDTEPDAKKAFAEFISTPLGLILAITLDQIIHLSFVLLCAFLIVTR